MTLESWGCSTKGYPDDVFDTHPTARHGFLQQCAGPSDGFDVGTALWVKRYFELSGSYLKLFKVLFLQVL